MINPDTLSSKSKSIIARLNSLHYMEREILQLRDLIRELCPHENREYWDDASGNNGGGWTCQVCGKDL